MFSLRFDFRNPAFAGVHMADRYQAGIEMAEWADRLGAVSIIISEHHGSEDGYLPSSLPITAAMAARTTNVRFNLAAMIAPFHDPLRLAEDVAVVDLISRGRLDVLIAGGYVHEEFELFGVAMKERVARVTEVVTTLKQALTNEPFEFRGRMVRITPAPFQAGGPKISMGGSSEPAARRAARIADGFMPSEPAIWAFYQDEMVKLGKPDPGPYLGGDTSVIALAEDADAGWEAIGALLPPRDERVWRVAGAGRRGDGLPAGVRHGRSGGDRTVPGAHPRPVRGRAPGRRSVRFQFVPSAVRRRSARTGLEEPSALRARGPPAAWARSRFMSAANQPDEHALAMAHAHAAAEGSGDLTTTLATLDDDPVYEFQPVGRVFRGKDTARRYYEHFFAHFSPLTESFEIRGEWSTPEGLGQEYTVWLRLPDGTRERHEIIGILLFGTSGLAGERVYASERLLRLMLGPIYDETTPLEAEEHS